MAFCRNSTIEQDLNECQKEEAGLEEEKKEAKKAVEED